MKDEKPELRNIGILSLKVYNTEIKSSAKNTPLFPYVRRKCTTLFILSFKNCSIQLVCHLLAASGCSAVLEIPTLGLAFCDDVIKTLVT
jgi:hypothetical protein